MDTQSKTDELKRRGFVNAGSVPAVAQTCGELARLIADVQTGLSPDHPHFLSGEEHGGGGFRGVPEHHPRIAELLDRLVCDTTVRSLLESVLGRDYKLWQIDVRRSAPGDKGLYVHQDAPGQVNLCLLLSDNATGDGATVFLPGSHLVQRRMTELQINIPPYLLMSLRRFFTPLTGHTGDVAFFFNRVWHGRFANRSNVDSNIILMGFFPAGGTMGFAPPYVKWSSEFLRAMEGTELGRLLDPDVGTERQGDGLYKVMPGNDSTGAGVSYAMAIEHNQGGKVGRVDASLTVFIVGLRAMMKSMGPLKPVARALRTMVSRGAAAK